MVLGGLLGEPLTLDRERPPSLLDLAVCRRSCLLGLAGRGDAQLLGLLLRGEPDLVALALRRGAQVLRLGHRERPLGLGVTGDPGAHLVELLELDDPHVVRLTGRLGADADRVAAGLLADLGGVALTGLADLGGLLLGQPQHRARAAAEPGVRRVGVLGELVLRLPDLDLELAHPLLGLGQGRSDSGPVLEDLPERGVDRCLVVAATADRGERRGRTPAAA